MIDVTQIVIILIILVLTTMLVVIGTQVYFILREFRTTLQKANKVLGDTGVISEAVSKPVKMISSIKKALSSRVDKPHRFLKSGRKL